MAALMAWFAAAVRLAIATAGVVIRVRLGPPVRRLAVVDVMMLAMLHHTVARRGAIRRIRLRPWLAATIRGRD